MKNLIPYKNVLASIMALVLLGVFFVSPAPILAQDEAVDDPDMIDKVTMKSGTTYIGEIIDESDDTITMLVLIAGISAQKTINKADCSSIRRDAVSRPGKSGSGGGMMGSASMRNESGKLDDRPDPNDPRPVVYRIPITGLMGWDVTPVVVDKLWEEAKEVHADYVIFEFDCRRGFFELDNLRDMFKDIEVEAAEEEIKLIAWVKEARGASVAFVLMFPKIVFHPDGWMGEGSSVDVMLKDRFEDKDVRAKMISAWVGHLRGMAIDGGHDAELCEAMIRPEVTLWVKMEGENPVFKKFLTPEEQADESVEVVDGSTGVALKVDADAAKIYGIAQAGTASNLRTLMNRIDPSVREFIHYEGKSTKASEDWTKLRERGIEDFVDYQLDLGMIAAMPIEPQKVIGQMIRKWDQILKLLKRCPPHAQPPYGMIKFNDTEWDTYGLMSIMEAEEMIAQLRQQMKQMNDSERRSRPGSGGGGRGKPGGPGG